MEALKLPLEQYNNRYSVADQNGHVATCEYPEFAESIVHAVNNIDRVTAERDGLKALLIRARDYIDLFSEPCSFLGPNLVKEIDAALATSSDTDADGDRGS